MVSEEKIEEKKGEKNTRMNESFKINCSFLH
jgi:hypothetical protein